MASSVTRGLVTAATALSGVVAGTTIDTGVGAFSERRLQRVLRRLPKSCQVVLLGADTDV